MQLCWCVAHAVHRASLAGNLTSARALLEGGQDPWVFVSDIFKAIDVLTLRWAACFT